MDTLVIFDEEESYVRRLTEYISEKNSIPFKVISFSDFERFRRYMMDKGADLLLATTNSLTMLSSSVRIGKLIMLAEGDMIGEGDELPYIYKYQSVEAILTELIEYYGQMEGHRSGPSIVNGRSTEIIAVYSPVGRSGKTSFSLAMGQILAADNHVLYMNMEEFSGLEGVMGKSFKSDLSDLMYHYRFAPDAIGLKLSSVVNTLHGMDYVPPMRYSSDLRSVDSDNWKDLILSLARLGIYDVIIVELSSMVGDVFTILEQCDIVYMPIKSDRVSLCKIEELEEYLLRTDREDIVSKTIKVQLPAIKSLGWDEDFVEQLVWGELGEYIRRLRNDEL